MSAPRLTKPDGSGVCSYEAALKLILDRNGVGDNWELRMDLRELLYEAHENGIEHLSATLKLYKETIQGKSCQ